jgi:adenylate kinase
LRGKSSGRPDDNDEATIRNRIFVYKNETTPVYDYYNLQHKSHSINGVGGVEDIFVRLCELIDAAAK